MSAARVLITYSHQIPLTTLWVSRNEHTRTRCVTGVTSWLCSCWSDRRET